LRRALVSLPDGVWKLIDNEFKGKLGDGDSEVIRNIVIAYLTSQGYFGKRSEKVGSASADDLAGELDVQDTMVTSLAELLEERGVIDYPAWEARIKSKLAKGQKKRRPTP
jgi:metal-responsive CopG/Arc/MetJ family transcriptional regulator